MSQFRTLVETGNLRRAADLLKISHSGLSKSIKALEQEVGYRLVIPSGRGLAITDEGRELYSRSHSFIIDLERLLGLGLQKKNERIRLGSFEVFTSHFIGQLVAEKFSDSEIEVHELIPGRLEEALLLNRIDIGITYEPIPRQGLEYIRVGSLLMMPYARRGAFKGRATLEVPFVVPVNPLEGTPSGVKGLDAWPEERFKRKAPFSVDLLSTGLELVRQSLCAIFIPEFVARLYNQNIASDYKLEELPLPAGMKSVKRDVYLVKRESTEENKSLQIIAKSLRQLCERNS